MAGSIDDKFREWTHGKSAVAARIDIFGRIRDIPYAVVPGINSALHYGRILAVGQGSCTPKHFLLRDMYERLGLPVLYVVYPYRWSDLEVDYPPHLRKLAEGMPISYHLACKVEIEGDLVLVDATVDRALKKLGLTVNEDWDGFSSTLLPVTPVGEEQLYHPAEVRGYEASYDEVSLEFFNRMNDWLGSLREAGL
jgi:hypothetical protein